MKAESKSLRPISSDRDTTLRELTEGQRRIVRLLQHIRYGRIHHLFIRNGQPVLDQQILWTRTIKVLGENGPHQAINLDEFTLCKEIRCFLQQLGTIGDGEVRNIEVRNGLPFSFELNESLTN
jgi:hypothetical protein